ncbi:MAG TPA: GGDEF domain-containing protein [Nautiliaceae bacterium]|nr:GGDEF domain-containing protein [Nautiliaceae bacterium]
MTINEIAKKTLAHFKTKGYIFTPDEYQEVFCKEAKKANILIKDCNKVAEYLDKLNKKYQLIAKNYNIKNLEELVLFLINYLNKKDSSKEKENLENLFIYTKRVLDVIAILPIIKSKKIAIKHLEFLKPNLKKEEFDKLRKEWFNFLSEFDDSIIKKAALITKVKSKDALEIIKVLLTKFEKISSLDLLVDAIIYTLTPSHAPSIKDDIVLLKNQLKKDSSFMLSKAFAQELKVLTNKRIKLDKEELDKKLKDLDKIAERLSTKILKIIEKSDGSSKEIKNITTELQNWRKDSTTDFEAIKEKLLTIVNSLDKEINHFKEEMKKEDEEIEVLRKKISLLEEKVKTLQKETKIDFLTNIANKKAILEEFNKQESIYKRSKTNYSIVFFDIDHFKNINDTFGHEAGDVILKSIGILLKTHIRDIDLVGRYGGEEFVAILPNTDKEEAFKLADKIKNIIKNTKFIYKNKQINVTISGGVAERNEVNSNEELLKLADERLYKAKKFGRDKIIKE